MTIDTNALATEYGLKILVESIRMSREIAKVEPLGAMTKKELYPREDKQTDTEPEECGCCAVGTFHHQVGTCKMGADDLAVVTPSLKARGISGLRVVDASIMPSVTTGNTNAPMIAIAE